MGSHYNTYYNKIAKYSGVCIWASKFSRTSGRLEWPIEAVTQGLQTREVFFRSGVWQLPWHRSQSKSAQSKHFPLPIHLTLKIVFSVTNSICFAQYCSTFTTSGNFRRLIIIFSNFRFGNPALKENQILHTYV